MRTNSVYAKPIYIVLVLIISISGFLGILVLTSNYTIGLNPDSVAYIAAARNFVQGRGFSVLYDEAGKQLSLWLPMHDWETSHVLPWPPFYPLVLSIPLFMNLDIIEGARWISAVFFGLNIFLIIFFIKKLTGSAALALIAGLLFLTSKELIHVFTFAFSETVFFFTGFLGAYFLFKYIGKPNYANLIISSALFAVTCYTRTAGTAFVAAGVIGILFFTNIKKEKRLLHSGIYFVVCLAPLVSWILWTERINPHSNYQLIFHPPGYDDYRGFLHTISSWVLPGRTPHIFQLSTVIVFILALGTLLVLFRTKFKNHQGTIENELNIKAIFLLIIFIILYVLVLLIPKTFLDANVPLVDARILSPVLLSVILIIVLTSKIVIDLWGGRKLVKAAVFSVLCLLITAHIAAMFYGPLIKKIYYEGQLYTSSQWVNSEIIEKIKELPPDAVIHTNAPDAVYILTGRNPEILPHKYNIYTAQKNKTFTSQIDSLLSTTQENHYIAFFNAGWYFIVKEHEIMESLVLVKNAEDGALYSIGQ